MPFFVTSALLSQHHVPHGFFTRHGGISTGEFTSLNCNPMSKDSQENIKHNIGRIEAALGFPNSTIHHLKQLHSTIVHEALDEISPPKGDAIFTRSTEKKVAVYTADCAPILLYASDIHSVAAIHAGWKGALNGIIQATILRLVSLGANPKKLLAAIGPCIQQRNYKVGVEFYDKFISADPANIKFFSELHFNPPAYCQHQLQLCGVEQIEDLAIDTYSDDFFSFRRYTHHCLATGIEKREGGFGAQLSVISLPRFEK